MASSSIKKGERPAPSKDRSHPRAASPSNSSRGQRASTTQNGVKPTGTTLDSTREEKTSKMQRDAFEKSPEEENYHSTIDGVSGKLPVDFDQLPIELISLSDRCVC